MHKIRLANSKEFTVIPDKSILDSALAKGIQLEYSCLTGRCGICKAQIKRGTSKLLMPEISLSEKDKQNSYTLLCCRKATSDLVLGVEDLNFLADIERKIVPCRIDTIKYLNADLIELTLRLPPSCEFRYLPGQYINIIAKPGLKRSYSIANAPREDGKITLLIRRVANGLMSKYWFSDAAPNDLLRIDGPLGTFCLRPAKVERLILLATGTGIAPIKAIYEHLSRKDLLLDFKNIAIYWGLRTGDEIHWRPENMPPHVEVNHVISRDSSWEGMTGHVQSHALSALAEPENTAVYACGLPQMIEEARVLLLSAGLPESNFYSDAFLQSGMEGL